MRKFMRSMLFASIVAFVLLAGNAISLWAMKNALQARQLIPLWRSVTVAGVLVAAGVYHLLAFFHLYVSLRITNRASVMRSATFVVGVLSLFLLAVDAMMLQDIGKEILFGHSNSGEWDIVFAGQTAHILFALMMLIQCAVLKRIGIDQPVSALMDEAFFLSVHQIGLLSSVFGFLCLWLLGACGLPEQYQNGLRFVSCVVILVPYALAAVAWFISKRKKQPTDWYDEKQFADLCRGSLIALVATTFLNGALYVGTASGLITVEVGLLLPSVLYMTLFVFSLSTLGLGANQ